MNGPLHGRSNLGQVVGPAGAGPVVPRPPPTAREPAGQNTLSGPAKSVAVAAATVASEVREQVAKTRKVRGAPALLSMWAYQERATSPSTCWR